ncbi:MAG TPA: peptidase domain-containing ABC transporter [Candidatus Limnocylindrales bacterium]|nr:peptidase domain-containing ABC transporter [Candidatus Limnocylindrales bacterium]
MTPNLTERLDGGSSANGADNEILARTSLFRFIPQEQQSRLQGLFKKAHYEFGEWITKQNDAADAFFVILSGRARVIRTDENGQELSLNSLGAGAEFGESALLSGGTRNASVRCSSSVDVLRLGRDDFLRLAEEFPEFKHSLELTARWRAMHGFLYQFSNFGRLPGSALLSLVDKLAPKEFAKGEIVLREGEPAGPMYIIEKGRVRVYSAKDGQVRQLAFLREGNFFGELSILTGAPRAGTVQALTDCRLLALAPDVVHEMNRQFPEFARLMEERRAQYSLATEAHVPLDFAQEQLPAESSTANKVELDEPQEDQAERPEIVDSQDPFADETGLFRKRKRRIRSIPLIQQIDEADCGAASLAMICRHFGRKVSLARIRQLCHTAWDGTSLKGITHAATELGLAARALKVSLRNLPRMPLPAIIHWQGNHWMVLLDVSPGAVRVADPASGSLRRIARAEFEQNWSGYAALFDYTIAFEKAPEGGSSAAWMMPFLKAHRRSLLQAMFLAGIASMLLLLLPIFTQVVVDKVIVEQDLDLLKLCVGGMLITGVFTLCSSVIQQYLLSFVAVHLDTGMLDFLMRNMLALPMSYFQSRRTGDIQRRLDGARQLRLFFVQHGIGGMLAGVQIIGCVVLMGVYSLMLLGIFALTMPLYVGLMIFSVKVLRPLFAELEEGQAKYSSYEIDAIKGIEAVKAAAAESSFRELMLNEFLRLSKKRFRWNFIVMSYDSVIQTISLLSTALFLWVGARMVIHAQISVGGFVAFNALVAMVCASAVRMLNVWEEFQMMLVLMNRLNDVFENEPEQGRDRSHLKPVPTLEGHVQLRHVGFRFGGPEAPLILDDINLEIAPGKIVAIVGRSGSGKTTLIKLIAGLLEPTEGTILFDHVDLKGLNYRDLRSKIGLVLQENHIFSDTILRNIAFGDPEPDFDRVLWAAQLANAHELISRLPFGYETRIGETGLALSGGQKQRVCIARALYHDPQVLIFDEATSALDSESERAIQENLNRLIKGRTCLVIAHRLSTIREADSILVLERGKVAELGTHDELMARRGLYFYLSSQQLAQ